MKKNGFVSTSLIYTFFILFLILMVFLISNYSSNRFMLDQYKADIKNDFMQYSESDINIYIHECQKGATKIEDCNLLEELQDPKQYNFNKELSRCDNNSKIRWDENESEISIEATNKDKCYIAFERK